MWRPVRKGELRYIRRMEERVWKRRMLVWMAWTLLALLPVLMLTGGAKLKEEERLRHSYISADIIKIFSNTGNSDGRPEAGDGRKEAQRRLDIIYYCIYGLEGLLAAGGYMWYGYSARQRVREILDGPLTAQSAVCTGKREYHNKAKVRVYMNVKTQTNETLRDIQVPWLIGSRIECEMPVLTVRYTRPGDDGEEETHYKLYPGRERHVERCQ